MFKDLIEITERYWKERTTRKGLVIFAVTLTIVFYAVCGVAYLIVDKLGILIGRNDFAVFLGISIAVWLILVVVLLIFWAGWRALPKLDGGDVGILFGPHSDRECREIVEQLYRAFVFELKRHSNGSCAVPRLLPENQSIHNAEEARNALLETGAHLVIWGRVNKGGIDGKLTEGFTEINCTIKQGDISPQDGHNLALAFSARDFLITQENSFFDKGVVSENLNDFATFFLGICLSCEGKFDSARIHWRTLLDRTTAKARVAQSMKYRAFHAVVNRWFANNEFFWAVVYYNTELLPKIGSRDIDIQAGKCRDVIDSLFPGTPDWKKCCSADLLNFRSILNFHFGEVREARRKLDVALKLNPNEPKVLFSLGFIHLWQGKFGPALKIFRRLEKMTVPSAVIVNVVVFYQVLIKRHPERLELLFGLAFVNGSFCDPSTALLDYSRFQKEAQGNPCYTELLTFTKARLNDYSVNDSNS